MCICAYLSYCNLPLLIINILPIAEDVQEEEDEEYEVMDNSTTNCTISNETDPGAGSSLNTVLISAAMAGLGTFIAGLLLGILLKYCHTSYQRKPTEPPPDPIHVYESVHPNLKLKENPAYACSATLGPSSEK